MARRKKGVNTQKAVNECLLQAESSIKRKMKELLDANPDIEGKMFKTSLAGVHFPERVGIMFALLYRFDSSKHKGRAHSTSDPRLDMRECCWLTKLTNKEANTLAALADSICEEGFSITFEGIDDGWMLYLCVPNDLPQRFRYRPHYDGDY